MKRVVLALTGSIASIKGFELCRALRKEGFKVNVVMSKAGEQMITKEAMEFASGNEVITEISGKIEHVEFFGNNGNADLLLIAPATANTISKIAMGIDDTPVTTMATVAIGAGKPVLIAPAMHQPMYEHPIVTENLEKLKEKVRVIAPLEEEGKAKMQSIEEIVFEVRKALSEGKLKGKKVVVASGAIQQKIDEIRVISNNSSGVMGEEIAKACMVEGGKVKVIGNGIRSKFVDFEEVREVEEFERKVMEELEKGADIFICPAAIPDFSVDAKEGKLSSEKTINLELKPREKFIEKVRKKFRNLRVVAFKAEWGISDRELEKAVKKMRGKYHLVAGIDLKTGGFGKENNKFFVSGKNDYWIEDSKRKIAEKIVRELE